MSKKKTIKNTIITAVTCLMIIIAAGLAFYAIKYFKEAKSLEVATDEAKSVSILKEQKLVEKASKATEYGDFTSISARLSLQKPTGEPWTEIDQDNTRTGFYCIETEEVGNKIVYQINPENICGHKMSEYNYIWVDAVNTGFYALLNISGEVVDLSNYYILVHDDTGNLASRLLINCYEAKVVKLSNTILTGTVIAPNANIEYDDTIVYGMVYGKASTGSRSFYREIPFEKYDLMLRDQGTVATFENYVMSTLVLQNLRSNLPSQYSTYASNYQLTTVDLENLTNFNASNAMIDDFMGDLDGMINLETLTVSGTKIQSLDVSKLTKLKKLDLSETNIHELIVPENCLIEELDISGTEIIYALDFSKFPNLKRLTVQKVTGFNGFTQKQNDVLSKQLEYLDFSGNSSLTSFNFKPYTKLTYINADETSLTGFDVSANAELTEIHANYIKVKELNFSANKKIERIYAYGSYSKIIVPNETVFVGKLKDTKTEVKG